MAILTILWQAKCKLTGTPGPYLGTWQQQHGGGSSAKTTLWEVFGPVPEPHPDH